MWGMFTRPHRACVALVVALCLGLGLGPQRGGLATAHAETAAELAARQAYARGAELYKNHKFAEAAAAFNEGYGHKPHYAFLWNLALAYHGLGDHEKAIDAYRRYLKDCPATATADRAAAQAAIADEQRAMEAPAVRSVATAAGPAAHSPATAAAPPTAPGTPDAVATVGHATEAKSSERKVWQKWWFWTATGAAALAVVGIGLGVGLSSSNSGSTAPYREVTWQ